MFFYIIVVQRAVLTAITGLTVKIYKIYCKLSHCRQFDAYKKALRSKTIQLFISFPRNHCFSLPQSLLALNRPVS